MTTCTWLDIYNIKMLDPIKPLTVLEWVICVFCTGDLRGVKGSFVTDVGLKVMCGHHIDFCLNEPGSWWGIAKVLMR